MKIIFPIFLFAKQLSFEAIFAIYFFVIGFISLLNVELCDTYTVPLTFLLWKTGATDK